MTASFCAFCAIVVVLITLIVLFANLAHFNPPRKNVWDQRKR